MENLAEKGVNVAEIEKQTKATEERILELDQKLEELPTTRENLIIQFREEKRQQLKQSEHKNYVKERAMENFTLFHEAENIEIEESFEIENDNLEQKYAGIKR